MYLGDRYRRLSVIDIAPLVGVLFRVALSKSGKPAMPDTKCPFWGPLGSQIFTGVPR